MSCRSAVGYKRGSSWPERAQLYHQASLRFEVEKVTLGRGSKICVPRSRNCISCVRRWPLQVYQLRPAVRKKLYEYRLRPGLSTPSMTSCVPRLVRNFISCVPRCLLLAYYWCPESSTVRVWVASKDMGIQNVQQFEGSCPVLLYITLYTIICTHTEVQNDIDNAQTSYHVTV